MEGINDVFIEFLGEAYDGPSHPYTWFINNDLNQEF
jgi:hypothetical protein